MAIYEVKWAAWGSFNPAISNYYVMDITAQLQSILDSGTTQVRFDGTTIPDPIPNVAKGWTIFINIDGEDYYYAGVDFQTVDFTQLPSNSVGRNKLSVSSVNATLVSGGWPTSENNFLFSACTFTITNNTGDTYPKPGSASSPWVSVDCYFSTNNSPTQPIDQLVQIGDVAVNVGTLSSGQSISVNVANLGGNQPGLFNMGRVLTNNPKLLPPGNQVNYYLYIQVRTDSGILLNEGAFSSITFAPNVPAS